MKNANWKFVRRTWSYYWLNWRSNEATDEMLEKNEREEGKTQGENEGRKKATAMTTSTGDSNVKTRGR